MKLLLTSNGLANQKIANALIELVEKPASDTSVAFIPTSANVEEGDKGWFINDLSNLKKQNFKCVDIVDISAIPKELWLPRLEFADVLFFSGGNTLHLMYWFRKSGLIEFLPGLLKTRVYAGISAGSIATGPSIVLSSDTTPTMDYEDKKYLTEEGLHLVNFYIRPHLNSPNFPKSQEKYLQIQAKEIPGILYAIDDESALKVRDGLVEIVSEGKSLVFNKK